MRILFITHRWIGDAVLASGVLSHLIDRHPDAHITVACGPNAAPLFEAVPNLSRIIAMPKRKWAGHWFRLWAATAGIRWDAVVDLRGSGIGYFQRVIVGAIRSCNMENFLIPSFQ